MRYAEDVTGEILKLSASFGLALISFLAFATYPARFLSKIIGIENVPFLGIAVLGGFLFVFWVSLAYRILGRNYGILTAVFIASISLLVTPWFGIVDPPWFGIFGIISFAVLGFLTEKINGGVGNSACLAINWIALAAFYPIFPPLKLAFVFLVVSFFSGLLGDVLAGIVSRFLPSLQEVSN
ncbi:hypothetical protein B6U96_10795 [Archaeoglobales archaeon ex4484_92]|nr:MAG: hypothetical protein B6U96_10795 [Archaeoglobales archaeon ex4484_92]